MRYYGCIPDLVGANRGRLLSASRPTMSASQLPEESDDLSQWFPPPMSQYSEGCCVGHGITAAMRFNWIVNGLPDLALSRNQLYFDARKKEGTTASDVGCQIHTAINVAQTIGVCAESLWPYDLTKWMDAPPNSVYPDALKHLGIEAQSVDVDPLAIRTALFLGKPVVIGMSVFPSFEGDDVAATGLVPMPSSSEHVLSGHCVDIYQYISTCWNGGPGFLFRNWWEEYDPVTGAVIVPWGIHGNGVLSANYMPQYGADLWQITMTEET